MQKEGHDLILFGPVPDVAGLRTMFRIASRTREPVPLEAGVPNDINDA